MSELLRFNLTVTRIDGSNEYYARAKAWSIQWYGVLSITMEDGTVHLYGIGQWRHAAVITLAGGAELKTEQAGADRPSAMLTP